MPFTTDQLQNLSMQLQDAMKNPANQQVVDTNLRRTATSNLQQLLPKVEPSGLHKMAEMQEQLQDILEQNQRLNEQLKIANTTAEQQVSIIDGLRNENDTLRKDISQIKRDFRASQKHTIRNEIIIGIASTVFGWIVCELITRYALI